jgi:3-oxoacyl-[acyl-carrier protein] reductase
MSNQNSRFKDKVVIVTGAAGGIGRAIAQRFASEGAHVVIGDVNETGAQQSAEQIQSAGGSAIPHPTNVADEASVNALFDATVARFGTVDVLINNAAVISTVNGMNVQRHILEGNAAWWRAVIDVNLNGAFMCSLRAANIMARKGSGNIINLSSGGATKAHRGMAAYDAAKGGIEAMTRAFALDLAPYGVRVNALVPGSIDTSGMDLATRQKRGQNIPLARVGEPDDMAGPALFLASDDARYITGHCLVVDGGMLVQQRSATVDIFPLSNFPRLER